MSLPLRDRRVPRRASLDALLSYAWQADAFTASEAMEVVDLSRSTTIEALDDLVHLGLVRELTNARDGGDYSKGRPSRRFALAADAAVVVGQDAGLAHIVTTVADLRGRTIAARTTRPPGDERPEDRRRHVADAIDAALAAAGRDRSDVLALCLGVPAPVDALGRSPEHRTGFWRRVNPDLGELFSWAPLVRVENDASLASIAEHAHGEAVGLAHTVTLLAGERLGAGVVVDGRLLRGAHGGAGELVAVRNFKGVEDSHGLGHLLAVWVHDLAGRGTVPADHPLLAQETHDDIGSAVFALGGAGDAHARALIERLGRRLARICGVFANFYDPQRIIVSGGIAGGIEAALGTARALLPKEVDLPAPDLVASRLGPDVVSIGAVAAALDEARQGALAIG